MIPFAGLRVRSEANRLERLVAGTAPTDVGAVTEGPTVVEGVVRKHRESVEPPLAGEECVYASYRRFRREGEGAGGDPVESTARAVPFLVEDGTGSVLVDPREAVDDEGGPVVVSGANTDRFYGDESRSDLVPIEPGESGELEAITDAREQLGTVPEWVHVQSAIRPGDEVYVLGAAGETPGGSPPYVLRPADDGTFLLSDLGRSALREQLARRTGAVDRRFWAFVVVGLIAVAVVVLTVAALADSFFLSL